MFGKLTLPAWQTDAADPSFVPLVVRGATMPADRARDHANLDPVWFRYHRAVIRYARLRDCRDRPRLAIHLPP